MMTQTTSYDHPTDKDQIDCVEQGAPSEQYPVLHLGNTAVWPTREQLVAIRDAIQGYLDAHPEPVKEPIAAETPREQSAEADAIGIQYTEDWF